MTNNPARQILGKGNFSTPCPTISTSDVPKPEPAWITITPIDNHFGERIRPDSIIGYGEMPDAIGRGARIVSFVRIGKSKRKIRVKETLAQLAKLLGDVA